jgi:hypothetical protein
MGNRTRDLPSCSAVPQPTAQQCTQTNMIVVNTKRAVLFFETALLNPGQTKVEFVVHKVAL